MNMKNYVGRMGLSNFKGQPLTAVMEVGAEDTGSDGYQQSNKEGSGKEGIWI